MTDSNGPLGLCTGRLEKSDIDDFKQVEFFLGDRFLPSRIWAVSPPMLRIGQPEMIIFMPEATIDVSQSRGNHCPNFPRSIVWESFLSKH